MAQGGQPCKVQCLPQQTAGGGEWVTHAVCNRNVSVGGSDRVHSVPLGWHVGNQGRVLCV